MEKILSLLDQIDGKNKRVSGKQSWTRVNAKSLTDPSTFMLTFSANNEQNSVKHPVCETLLNMSYNKLLYE